MAQIVSLLTPQRVRALWISKAHEATSTRAADDPAAAAADAAAAAVAATAAAMEAADAGPEQGQEAEGGAAAEGAAASGAALQTEPLYGTRWVPAWAGTPGHPACASVCACVCMCMPGTRVRGKRAKHTAVHTRAGTAWSRCRRSGWRRGARRAQPTSPGPYVCV